VSKNDQRRGGYSHSATLGAIVRGLPRTQSWRRSPALGRSASPAGEEKPLGHFETAVGPVFFCKSVSREPGVKPAKPRQSNETDPNMRFPRVVPKLGFWCSHSFQNEAAKREREEAAKREREEAVKNKKPQKKGKPKQVKSPLPAVTKVRNGSRRKVCLWGAARPRESEVKNGLRNAR
jgi:hypothetical protein